MGYPEIDLTMARTIECRVSEVKPESAGVQIQLCVNPREDSAVDLEDEASFMAYVTAVSGLRPAILWHRRERARSI